MGKLFKGLIAFSIIIAVLTGAILGFICTRNHYQVNGNLVFPGIESPVRVIRDEKNMPYIYGNSLTDVVRVQGFVTAQDRLFQMHLSKLFASGRLSELAGDKARDLDLRMRTLGFKGLAKKHAALLSDRTRTLLECYRDGINTYIKTGTNTLHLEFRLAGLEIEPWTIEDSLTLMYYMGWGTAANLKTELIAQMIVETLGVDAFNNLRPVNTNIDDPGPVSDNTIKTGHPFLPETKMTLFSFTGKGFRTDRKLLDFLLGNEAILKIGSNNWCVSSGLSQTGKPVLANDPHLSVGMLPGIYYPSGLIFDDMRVVGVTIAGFPGAIIGRSSFVAAGVTNSYGDNQDLYIETIDPDKPDHYMEGDVSYPFEVREEILKIKDKSKPDGYRFEPIKIRSTRRGPVVSGVLPGLKTDHCITVRWSPAQTMGPEIGFDYLIRAHTTKETINYLKHITAVNLNITSVDTHGTMSWQTTGRLPIRIRGDGTLPLPVDDSPDNWQGFIPFDMMPHTVKQDQGWIGNANQNTIPADYPYYVSSYFAPYYRYKRLQELMETPGKKLPEDHWNYQRDTVNVLARKLVPVFTKVLRGSTKTADIAQILENWNFRDDADRVAPTLYHAIYERIARLTFSDELGPELTPVMLNNWYFWQERLETMIMGRNSPWFDDINTDQTLETLPDLIVKAALEVTSELTKTLGPNIASWTWRRVHKLEFMNPILRDGPGKKFVGGRVYSMDGSCDTLHRALYPFETPGNITIAAALRMVIDLSDNDKILAVLPGGVTGRTFSSHFNDQVDDYMTGKKYYWWYSDKMIKAHKQSELICVPKDRH